MPVSKVAIIAVGLLAIAFAAVHGILMAVSPKRYAAFYRWYMRGKVELTRLESRAQVRMRIAGLLLAAISIFMGWVLVGTILGSPSWAQRKNAYPITGNSFWVGIVGGVLAIVWGVYSLLCPSSVARWFENRGLHDTGPAAAHHRQIRILGVCFILAGGFFVAVAIRNH